MKPWLAMAFGLAWLAALGGCALHDRMPAAAPELVAAAVPVAAADIETVQFRVGVSSVTVEKMAHEQGCLGGPGASLAGEPGSVETYRMRCASGPLRGQVFMARCDMRQCRQM